MLYFMYRVLFSNFFDTNGLKFAEAGDGIALPHKNVFFYLQITPALLHDYHAIGRHITREFKIDAYLSVAQVSHHKIEGRDFGMDSHKSKEPAMPHVLAIPLVDELLPCDREAKMGVMDLPLARPNCAAQDDSGVSPAPVG